MKTEEQIRADIARIKGNIEILEAHFMTGKERTANSFQLICARESLDTLLEVIGEQRIYHKQFKITRSKNAEKDKGAEMSPQAQYHDTMLS
jgi:hypothetical protein